MTSAQRLESEIELLELRRDAFESDLRFKEVQYNRSMPCDEGMDDSDVAILMMSGIVRDRDHSIPGAQQDRLGGPS